MSITTIIHSAPFTSILVISFLITLFTTLIYKYTTNQQHLKQIKEDLKKFRQEMRNYKDDPKKMMEIQKKSMELSMQSMKSTLKPTFITMIPLLLVFVWLSNVYKTVNANNITGAVTAGKIMVPVFSFSIGWIWVYIISSVIFSIVIRKILKVY